MIENPFLRLRANEVGEWKECLRPVACVRVGHHCINTANSNYVTNKRPVTMRCRAPIIHGGRESAAHSGVAVRSHGPTYNINADDTHALALRVVKECVRVVYVRDSTFVVQRVAGECRGGYHG